MSSAECFRCEVVSGLEAERAIEIRRQVYIEEFGFDLGGAGPRDALDDRAFHLPRHFAHDRFGERTTEFEVVDFTPPTTFGWVERGGRNGWKTFFRLDPSAQSTAVTVRDVWAPRTLIAWVRGRLFEKRRVNTQLEAILANVRKILAT